jgi:hypothetical protein
VCALGCLLGLKFGFWVRAYGFAQLAERSKPLVKAIKEYDARFGQLPASLEGLVPEFLPFVPLTGMAAYPHYEYATGEKAETFDGNPWVLYVNTPNGLINWDMFMYLPLQNYPEKGYGGSLERIGDWAYMHE